MVCWMDAWLGRPSHMASWYTQARHRLAKMRRKASCIALPRLSCLTRHSRQRCLLYPMIPWKSYRVQSSQALGITICLNCPCTPFMSGSHFHQRWNQTGRRAGLRCSRLHKQVLETRGSARHPQTARKPRKAGHRWRTLTKAMSDLSRRV